MSEMLLPTLKEDPVDAEAASHRLMLRAGLMRRTAAGMYTFLPLGMRVLQKVMEIVRQEMDAAGAQEVLLPIVQPAELWRESGRWDAYGDEMFRLNDRHGRQFCLGPTHEEIVTALARAEVHSYRQLPLNLYQIQNKYRDEIRPRFGVIRGREFIMKDAYSFDRDEEGMRESYRRMYEAYHRIFKRCGLTVRAVEADTGNIGGDESHEFMLLCDVGEAAVVFCQSCDYAANVERAAAVPRRAEGRDPDREPALERIPTPGLRTVEELTAALGVSASSLLKTLIYVADGEPVAVVLRGDRSLNEVKLARLLKAGEVALADAETTERVTGAPVGFAGPVGLEGVRLLADLEVEGIAGGVTGANAADAHYRHVCWGRDFTAELADLRETEGGDACPACGGTLAVRKGIEVGQVFQLGVKYSKAMGATFKDESGAQRPMVMGCYGIGVSRTVAAVIEEHHDEHGIKWPVSVAPFEVGLVCVRPDDERQRRAAETLYEALRQEGLDVLYDDRDERPGVKFKDADLIGLPYRLTVGPRSLETGEAELRRRSDGSEERLPLHEAAALLASEVKRARRSFEEVASGV